MRIHHPFLGAAAAAVVAGCGGSNSSSTSPALNQGAACTPPSDPVCDVPLVCNAATSTCDYAVCPAGIANTSTFTSVRTIFASCTRCHTPMPAATTPCPQNPPGPCSGLDLETDPYGALVNVPGIHASAMVTLRVAPGDSANSLLYRKLTTTSQTSDYGRGMPYGAPGSVCPDAVNAVKAWIDAGAQNN